MNTATCFFCSATTSLPYTKETLESWSCGIVIMKRDRDGVKTFDLCPDHKGRDQECLLHIIGGVQMAMVL